MILGVTKCLDTVKYLSLPYMIRRNKEAIVWIPKGMHLDENAKLI